MSEHETFNEDHVRREVRAILSGRRGAPGRKIRGVPLTHDEQVLARETASELETEKLADVPYLLNIAECAAGGLPESAKPAFYATFYTQVALRQGTLVNAVLTHCVISLNTPGSIA